MKTDQQLLDEERAAARARAERRLPKVKAAQEATDGEAARAYVAALTAARDGLDAGSPERQTLERQIEMVRTTRSLMRNHLSAVEDQAGGF